MQCVKTFEKENINQYINLKLEPFKTISRNTKGRDKMRFMYFFALDTGFLGLGLVLNIFFNSHFVIGCSDSVCRTLFQLFAPRKIIRSRFGFLSPRRGFRILGMDCEYLVSGIGILDPNRVSEISDSLW